MSASWNAASASPAPAPPRCAPSAQRAASSSRVVRASPARPRGRRPRSRGSGGTRGTRRAPRPRRPSSSRASTSGSKMSHCLARCDGRAAAVPDADQPALLERADALARDAAADVEASAARSTSRGSISPCRPRPGDDLGDELAHHLPVQSHAEIESCEHWRVNACRSARAPRRQPAVDHQRRAGDVARIGRPEERDRRRRSPPARPSGRARRRRASALGGAAVGGQVDALLDQAGAREPGADAVDAHAVRAVVEREAPGQADEARLRGGVREEALARDDRVDRGDVDDRPAARRRPCAAGRASRTAMPPSGRSRRSASHSASDIVVAS